MSERFFGKYRGIVTNNQDPVGRGRIKAQVPLVAGEVELPWATPCVPYGGPSAKRLPAPPVGMSVWIEFEGGDARFPIFAGWTGAE